MVHVGVPALNGTTSVVAWPAGAYAGVRRARSDQKADPNGESWESCRWSKVNDEPENKKSRAQGRGFVTDAYCVIALAQQMRSVGVV